VKQKSVIFALAIWAAVPLAMAFWYLREDVRKNGLEYQRHVLHQRLAQK
jgi:hypothetical protein